MDSLALRAVYFDDHPAVGHGTTGSRRAVRTDGAGEDSPSGDEARRAVQVALDRRDNGGWS